MTTRVTSDATQAARVSEVVLVSSVAIGPLQELKEPLAARLGVPVRVESVISDTEWQARRAAGRATGLRARIRGLLFPLHVRTRGGRTRVLVATTNPFWLPTLLALRRARPLVALVYDVYPDALNVRWRLPRWVSRIVSGVFGYGLRRADAVVVLGPRIGATLTARHRLVRPVTVIPTGADPADFDAITRTSVDGVLVSYVGNTGSVHDGATLGAALATVLHQEEDVHVVMATRGDRAADLVGPLRTSPRARIVDRLAEDERRSILAATDIALVTLDARAGTTSVPSKLYPSLAAGCAVLAITPDDSDLADIVRATGAGVVVAPGDIDGAVAALRHLVRDPAARADHAQAARVAAERFRPDVLADRWATLLNPHLAD